ncbi:23S rRNA (pseudouridine(1915)-N(3))-methyltransferase RlmH [Alienimonas californiensis]|uniref:Glycosyltransferase RgtA/B/C/D-like domain-containing protein n=1 Tax=Alienimonas californiensis TaxID=2527989 RepID=A0A517P9Q9_9PLAN|nr:23S rRNA (pseudouridine(1915)-N(3))-methyltransferase RlmH [Alienimonas californiensis]QDT16116.1 hypothetical protein CA12_22140 [Alienimonas californiensis]
MTPLATPAAPAPSGQSAPVPAAPVPAPADEGPSDAHVLMLAAKPGERLFRVLESPNPLRPLLAALAVLPAVLASPRCRLDRVDPDWGVACLEALNGDSLTDVGPAAWLTGRLLAVSGTEGPVPYFALSWAGATLLVWAVWQLTAAAAGARPAAFAALLIAANPVTAAAAASAPPTVAGAALAVIAAWLWVRASRRGSPAVAALAGAAAGAGALLAGWFTALTPAAVAAADFLLALLPARGDEPREPDRGWERSTRSGRAAAADRPAETLGRLGMFFAGFGVTAVSALAFGPSPAWEAAGLSSQGVWLLAGLAVTGLAAALAGRRWMAPAARRVVLGLAGAATVLGAAAWTPRLDGGGADVGVLAVLIAATVAAAVGLEGACRPAVSARGVAALTLLPVLVLLSGWIWSEEPWETAVRAVVALGATIGLWGLWEVVAYRWPRTVRDRRLLIVAVVALAATGLKWSVRGTNPSAGRGTRQLVAALAERPETRIFVLAEQADQQAAKFLFSAAAPGRLVFVLDPRGPRVADLLNDALAVEPSPLVAVVGGGPAARLNALRPAGAAPPAPVGVLLGGDGVKKEVRLLVLPSNPRAEPG